jgi:hypothetical protein
MNLTTQLSTLSMVSDDESQDSPLLPVFSFWDEGIHILLFDSARTSTHSLAVHDQGCLSEGRGGTVTNLIEHADAVTPVKQRILCV